jgi:hypothetical protein
MFLLFLDDWNIKNIFQRCDSMNKVLYFKLGIKQESNCEAINKYCQENNCEPISVASDKFGNIIVVVKELN